MLKGLVENDVYGDYGAINIGLKIKTRDNVSGSDLVEAYDAFITTLKRLYDGQQTVDSPYTPIGETTFLANNDLKLSLYCTLRNLYDRWFANSGPER